MPTSKNAEQRGSSHGPGRGEIDMLLALFSPDCCERFVPSLEAGELTCASCGRGRPVRSGPMILTPSLEEPEQAPAEAEYVRETKHRYQSDVYATAYLKQYSVLRNPRALYASFVADRERALVDKHLRRILPELGVVLDMPAGTGKLAEVHAKYGYEVVAADVSAHMMDVGLRSGQWTQCENLAGFVQSDITATDFDDEAFDASICLRLLHRLSEPLARRAMAELSRITRRYLIVSTALARRSVATVVRGGRDAEHLWNARDWEALLESFGTILGHAYVARFASNGVVSLVKLDDNKLKAMGISRAAGSNGASNGPVLVARSSKSEVRLVENGLVEKRYLTDDANERACQDEKSLRFLQEALGTIHWENWQLGTVRSRGLGEDGRSIRLEHVPGVVAARLAPDAMKVCERLFGVWLGEYEKRVLKGRDAGALYTDLSLHNAILDAENRKFTVFDPGKAFGRAGYIYEDIALHIESLLAACVRRRMNPGPPLKAFLEGYVATRATELDGWHYAVSVARTKRQMVGALVRQRPKNLALFLAMSAATVPLWLWYLPRKLARKAP